PVLVMSGSDDELLDPDAEIEQALHTYLGDELTALEAEDRPGQPIWDGDRATISIRRATDAEAAVWRQSLTDREVRSEDDQAPPNERDWLLYLVRVRDLDHDEDEEEDA